MDGISLPLVWLTTLLLFIGVPASYSIKNASKAYYALLLLLEVGILGVFVSLDYFLFYAYPETKAPPPEPAPANGRLVFDMGMCAA